MKKVIASLLASAMVLGAVGGLAACGDDSKTLVVWAPTAAISGYESLVAEWKEANPEYADYKVTFTAVDEGETETNLNTDASKGADVFFFEAGQITGLQEKNLLQDLGTTVTAQIKSRDASTWYEPILNSAGNAVAFPTTGDNGYFLWYDSTVYSEEDVKTLDKMLEIAKAQNKNIMFDYANGWYLPSFWFGAGLSSDYDGDEYKTEFNSEVGQKVALAVNGYLGPDNNKMANGNPCIITAASDLNSEIGTGFANGSVAAGVIGTWVAKDIKDKMDDKTHESHTRTDDANYDSIKCAKLPTYTLEGEQKQMGSFMGGKYCGVNAQKTTGNIEVSISLANFFTGERGQTVRFEKTQAGPTNINVAATDEVKADKALVALIAQNDAGGYLQFQQSANFWTAHETFGNAIFNGTSGASLSDTALLDALATLATTILT